MTSRDRQDRREQDVITDKTLRPPQALTLEQSAAKQINKIIKDLPKEIDDLLRPKHTPSRRAEEPDAEEEKNKKPDLEINRLDSSGKRTKQPWTNFLSELTSRLEHEETRGPGGGKIAVLENLEAYKNRHKTVLGEIRSSLYDEHIKAMVKSRMIQIKEIIADTNDSLERDIRGLPGKTVSEKDRLVNESRLDRRFIMERARQEWFGPVIDETTQKRTGGTIAKVINKATNIRMIEASQKNFDDIIKVENSAIDLDKWIRSVTNLEDSELKKIVDSRVLATESREFAKDLCTIRDKLLTCAISTGCVAGVGIGIGAVFPGGIGALSTGLGTAACAGLLYKSWDLSRDFRDRLKTVWDTTAAQLHKPANMDAARAWAGVFFKVIRDFNPMYFRKDSTDYWAKTDDSKVDAVLNSIKAGGKYSADVTHEKQLTKGTEQPLYAVAADEKFGTYIERVSSELSNLRDRWRSFPTFYQGVTIATTVFSSVTFIAQLAKFLEP